MLEIYTPDETLTEDEIADILKMPEPTDKEIEQYLLAG